MLDILSTYVNQDGALFPNTLAVDSSGALSTDGTEFIAAFVNDYGWGPMQAILAYTSQTPNGVLESPTSSQFLEAIRRMTVYPGTIFHAAWNVDPTTIPIRAIKMTGQGILRANYPLLDTMVYCGNANNATYTAFFRADNANGTSRNTAGAYLILPDMRGRVIRALDIAAGVDPDGASRYPGSLQFDALYNHYHRINFKAGSAGGGTVTLSGSGNVADTSANWAIDMAIGALGGTLRTAIETRMINASFDCYITF